MHLQHATLSYLLLLSGARADACFIGRRTVFIEAVITGV